MSDNDGEESTEENNKENKATITIVYDKECPACDFYCSLIRIKESVGQLVLLDAREPSKLMDEITRREWDIDQGMVVAVDDALYYGSDAIHILSVIGGASNCFNRLNYYLFSSKRRASILYPFFKFFRNMLLKILRKTKINNLKSPTNKRF